MADGELEIFTGLNGINKDVVYRYEERRKRDRRNQKIVGNKSEYR